MISTDGQMLETVRVFKGIVGNCGNTLIDNILSSFIHGNQAIADIQTSAGPIRGIIVVSRPGKSVCADARDTIGNLDARQASASGERRIANMRDTLGNRDPCQAAATIES